jgi:hypothetical protein
MITNQQVPLMLSIPKTVRNKLRIMAAQMNLKNPNKVTSASTIAKEIVCEYLANQGLPEGDSQSSQSHDSARRAPHD